MHPEASPALSPRFATEAFHHKCKHNICFRPKLPDLPPDHPAQTRFTTSNLTLCADQLGDSPPVRGSVKRVITVFFFFDRPDMRFTQAEQIGFYGWPG